MHIDFLFIVVFVGFWGGGGVFVSEQSGYVFCWFLDVVLCGLVCLCW